VISCFVAFLDSLFELFGRVDFNKIYNYKNVIHLIYKYTHAI